MDPNKNCYFQASSRFPGRLDGRTRPQDLGRPRRAQVGGLFPLSSPDLTRLVALMLRSRAQARRPLGERRVGRRTLRRHPDIVLVVMITPTEYGTSAYV